MTADAFESSNKPAQILLGCNTVNIMKDSISGIDYSMDNTNVIVRKNIRQREINIISWAANQYIRIISEGLCDTEDWINYAENTGLITGIK